MVLIGLREETCFVRRCLAPREIGFKSYWPPNTKDASDTREWQMLSGRHYPRTQAQRTEYGPTHRRLIAPTDTKLRVTAILKIPNQHPPDSSQYSSDDGSDEPTIDSSFLISPETTKKAMRKPILALQTQKETTIAAPLKLKTKANHTMPVIARSPGLKSPFVPYYRRRYTHRNGKAREQTFFSAI